MLSEEKIISKCKMLYDSTYRHFWNEKKNNEQVSGCPALRMLLREGGSMEPSVVRESTQGTFERMDLFYISTGGYTNLHVITLHRTKCIIEYKWENQNKINGGLYQPQFSVWILYCCFARLSLEKLPKGNMKFLLFLTAAY